MTERKPLPAGWKWVKLGEVAEYINGRAFKPSEWGDSGIPIIRIQNLNNPVSKYNFSKFIHEPKYKVENGNLLFSWSASLGVYIWKGKTAWLNQHIFKVVPKNHSDKMYLYYLLAKTISEFYTKVHGSGMVHITKRKFEETIIPFPPLPVQQAIVSKIEELFSELDKGIEDLKTAQLQLKTYRQSVLKWAFEGKLSLNLDLSDTPDGHDVPLAAEPVAPYSPDSSDSVLYTLPKGWKWVRLGEVCKVVTGSTPSKANLSFYGPEFPFYKPSDLDVGTNIHVANDNLTKLGLENGRFAPPNSILVTCIGATIGKTGILKKGGAFNQQINAVLPNIQFTPMYLFYQIISGYFQDQIKNNASSTTLPILNKTKFESLFIVSCPLNEQHLIVQEIESRLSVADKMEETITQSLQQAEVLRQSILKRAFEGKLV